MKNDLKVPPENIRNLRNSEATREAIIEAFNDLRDDPQIKKNDPIVIFYAGHGGQTNAPKGWDSEGGKVQYLIPYDVETVVNGKTVHGIPDRTIATFLNDLAGSKGDNVV